MDRLDRSVQAVDPRQSCGQLLGHPAPSRRVRRFVTSEVTLESDEQAHDLFLAGLHGPTDPVPRRPSDDPGLEQRTACPGGCLDVHVLVLQRDGQKQVGSAREDARRLWTANGLSAAESDEVCAGRGEAAQVGSGRQTNRRIHDHRKIVLVGSRHEDGERQADGFQLCMIEGAHRPGADRGLHLGRHPCERRRAVAPELDQSSTGRADHVVVRVAMHALDENLVRMVAGVGQKLHSIRIHARENRRGCKGHPGRRARGHVARLCSGGRSDDPARSVLQVADPNERSRGFAHCRGDFRVHQRAAGESCTATGVHHPPHPEASVDRRLAFRLGVGRAGRRRRCPAQSSRPCWSSRNCHPGRSSSRAIAGVSEVPAATSLITLPVRLPTNTSPAAER